MSPQQTTSATRVSTSSGRKRGVVEVIAKAVLDRPANVSYPSIPGRRIKFFGGEASIYDVNELPYILRRDDLTIYPSERYEDWYPDWIASCGEHEPAVARIEVKGVLHFPPYATLLEAQSPEESTVVGEDQGAVQPIKRGPGRPPRAWS